MVEKVKALGPLGLPGRFTEFDREMEHLEAEAGVKEVAHAG
jgi:hypothetical protein